MALEPADGKAAVELDEAKRVLAALVELPCGPGQMAAFERAVNVKEY